MSILASSGGELVGAFMPEFWSYAASRYPYPEIEVITRVAEVAGTRKNMFYPGLQVCDGRRPARHFQHGLLPLL